MATVSRETGAERGIHHEEDRMRNEEVMTALEADRDALRQVMIDRIIRGIKVLIRALQAVKVLGAVWVVVTALREEMQGRTIDSRVKEKIKVLLRKHP